MAGLPDELDPFKNGTYSPEGVDRSLIRLWLRMSPQQRLSSLEAMASEVVEIRERIRKTVVSQAASETSGSRD